MCLQIQQADAKSSDPRPARRSKYQPPSIGRPAHIDFVGFALCQLLWLAALSGDQVDAVRLARRGGGECDLLFIRGPPRKESRKWRKCELHALRTVRFAPPQAPSGKVTYATH